MGLYMEMAQDLKSDDAGDFFLRKAFDSLMEIAEPKPGGFFIHRRDCYLRLAQSFHLHKEESMFVLRMLEQRGLAYSRNRGVILHA